MATTIWKGHIAFGLLSFSVRSQAVAPSQSVSFNQLHQCDHSRIKQVLCQAEDKPVSRSELVTGFEYQKDTYVVEERELDQIAPRSSRVMEVVGFIAGAEVDPVYLDASGRILLSNAGRAVEKRSVTSCQAGVSGDGSSTRLAHWSASHRVPRSMSATPFICYALTLLF